MYVNSLDDFYIHTKNHINNVVNLAEKLLDMVNQSKMLKKYYNIPEGEDFNKIKEIVLNGIRMHDQAKININKDFLEKHGLIKPLYEELYSRYGKGRSEEEWKITKPIIDKLNAIDEEIVNNYAEQFEPWLENLIKGIESISDKVERGQNPITPEEMGQPPTIASKFLEGQINEYEMAMVKVLEERYHDFCEYRLNKAIISKDKYYSFIESFNLKKYIVEDDLCFFLKKDMELEIFKTEELISKDINYNKVLFEISRSNLEEHLENWLSIKKIKNKLLVEKEESNENYQIKIKDVESGRYFLSEKLVSYKDKNINKMYQKQFPFLAFLYEKDSPLFEQNKLNNLVNFNSLDLLKTNIDNIYKTNFFEELDEFINELNS